MLRQMALVLLVTLLASATLTAQARCLALVR